MSRLMKSATILSAATICAAFFTYGEDCKADCPVDGRACSIREMDANYFPCDCYDLEASCMAEASPKVVCLRKDGPAKGGKEIWEDYNRHKHPTTPRPGPGPSPPNPEVNRWFRWMIGYSVGVTIILLAVVSYSLKNRVLWYFRREYIVIEERRPLAEQELPNL